MRTIAKLFLVLFAVGCSVDSPIGVDRPTLGYSGNNESEPTMFESQAGFVVNGSGNHYLGAFGQGHNVPGTYYFHDGTTVTEYFWSRDYPANGSYLVYRVVGTDTARYTVRCNKTSCR